MTRQLSIIAALVGACGHDNVRSDAAGPTHVDAQVAQDSKAADAPQAPPMLQCDPSTADPSQLCACVANIACDQIYYCLPATEIATHQDWSPKATCIDSLRSDCLEDLGDPALFPTDFRACVSDIATRSCDAFDHFTTVAMSFPPSCKGLRSLDTGLGIQQGF